MKKTYDNEEYEEYYRTRDIQSDRVILHSDLNNFFASVEMIFDEKLKNVPLAVCGDVEARHGIVLAKNEEAKKYGIKTGDTVNTVEKKCPFAVICPTHYDRYVKYSRLAREIYLRYATRIEPFGIDEAWIDISDLAKRKGGDIFLAGRSIAEEIRRKVREELGVTVSIGVSFNKTLSKFASDMKKPDAVTLISYSDFKNMIWRMPVEELLFVGRKTKELFRRMGIETVGDLAAQKRGVIKGKLGKFGEALWDKANGYDVSPVSYYHCDNFTASISNSTTTPFDMTTPEQVGAVLLPIAEGVSERLRKRGSNASILRIYVKHSDLSSYVRQTRIKPSNDTDTIFKEAFSLLTENVDFTMPLRAVGIGAEGFSDLNTVQQDIFNPQTELDVVLDGLRTKYGDSVIKRAIVMKNSKISSFDKKHVAFNHNI